MENICHVVRATFSLVEKKNGGGRNLEKETYFCIEKNRKGGKYLEKIITFLCGVSWSTIQNFLAQAIFISKVRAPRLLVYLLQTSTLYAFLRISGLLISSFFD